MNRDERDEMDRQAKSRDYGPVDQTSIEHRLRKIEASLEWMSSSDNILAEALDELEDKIEQLESTITTAGWMKYIEDKIDGLEVTGAKPQPDSDGWIPHDGGECPVSPDCLVDYIIRVDEHHLRETARILRWSHTGGPGDIIAYRPAKQEAEWPREGIDKYWFIDTDGMVEQCLWYEDSIDGGRRNFTGVYPTREAAEAAAPKISRIMNHLRAGHEVILATDTRMVTAEKVEL